MKRSQLIGIVVALVLVYGTLLGIHAARAREGAGTWHIPTAQERVASAVAALEQEGLSASLDALERAATEDSAVLRDGHQLAHALGSQALDRPRGIVPSSASAGRSSHRAATMGGRVVPACSPADRHGRAGADVFRCGQRGTPPRCTSTSTVWGTACSARWAWTPCVGCTIATPCPSHGSPRRAGKACSWRRSTRRSPKRITTRGVRRTSTIPRRALDSRWTRTTRMLPAIVSPTPAQPRAGCSRDSSSCAMGILTPRQRSGPATLHPQGGWSAARAPGSAWKDSPPASHSPAARPPRASSLGAPPR